MTLIQIFLPLYDNAGEPISADAYECVRQELTERFGGMTGYSRTPARGLWKGDDHSMSQDELVIYEIMVKQLDRQWWNDYRQTLESRFGQEQILIRSQTVEIL